MPAVAVFTLIGVGILVVVLAGYLIRVAFILWQVVRQLEVIIDGVVAVSEEAAPIGQVANAINADLDAGRRALEGAVARLGEEQALSQEPQPTRGQGSAKDGTESRWQSSSFRQ